MNKIIPILSMVGLSLFGDITPNVPEMPFWASMEDLAVAQTIAGEARCQSELGQSMVADVIFTRCVKRDLTPYEVVSQPNQFIGFDYSGHEISNHIWTITRKLKAGLDIIKEVEYDQFRAYKISPMPKWGKDPVIVGGHIFFKED